MDLSQLSLLDDLHRPLEMRAGPLLQAHLDYAVVFSCSFNHQPPFANAIRNGFLDIDVSAGVAGVNASQRAPVVRGCNNDNVDIFVFQKLAIIFVGSGLAFCKGRRFVQIGLVDIT